MKFARIPSGTFLMGPNYPDEPLLSGELGGPAPISLEPTPENPGTPPKETTATEASQNPSSDATKQQNRDAVHEVTISRPFYLGIYEVTEADWSRVMGGNKGTSTRPVAEVSWNEAVSFCEKLSALPEERAAGRVYRLPTEAEWEYACRAGATTKYPHGFGNEAEQAGDFAWTSENSSDQPHPVGQKKPNPWGLYDMIGNIAEYCSDKRIDWLKPSPVTDPHFTESTTWIRVRGGSYLTHSITSTTAWGTGSQDHDRWPNEGFRVALTISNAGGSTPSSSRPTRWQSTKSPADKLEGFISRIPAEFNSKNVFKGDIDWRPQKNRIRTEVFALNESEQIYKGTIWIPCEHQSREFPDNNSDRTGPELLGVGFDYKDGFWKPVRFYLDQQDGRIPIDFKPEVTRSGMIRLLLGLQ
jgi:formylglycine-generating enzyme required for sulfatase activity